MHSITDPNEPTVEPGNDDVVLVDDQGRPIGRHDRQSVHSDRTPRHLAMSCWIVREDGSVLITRRALEKRSWPGVWTNSCCGHPRPDESIDRAVRRRVHEELGIVLMELSCLLPDFSYRAVDQSGIVEDEFCPVFRATAVASADLAPDRAEVMDWTWQPPDRLRTAVRAAPYAFSPWSREQLALLGPDGLATPGGSAC